MNSQLYGDPAWQPDSSTGIIEEQLDVEALTAEQDIDLTLYASTMNVRDHLFPTTVTAELGAEPTLRIRKIDRGEDPPLVPKAHQPNWGDCTYYSIPRSGDRNATEGAGTGKWLARERWFTLTVGKPKDAKISKLKLVLRNGEGGDLQQLLNEAVENSSNIKVKDNGETAELKVRASMITYASSINSVPPPMHHMTSSATACR